MLSKTTEYALRAVIFLAKGDGNNTTSQLIAEATCVPEGYMSKVLNTLTRNGIVTSQRGPTGGFALIADPQSLTMLDIVQAVEPLPKIQNCPLHLTEHKGNLCPLHTFLAELVGVVENKLASTTVADIIHAPQSALGDVSPCNFPINPTTSLPSASSDQNPQRPAQPPDDASDSSSHQPEP